MISSDKGLMLEMSALKLFMVANIYVINSVDDTKLPSPLLYILCGKLLWKWGLFKKKKTKQNKNYSTSFNIIIKSFKEIFKVNLIVSIVLQYSMLLVFKLLM